MFLQALSTHKSRAWYTQNNKPCLFQALGLLTPWLFFPTDKRVSFIQIVEVERKTLVSSDETFLHEGCLLKLKSINAFAGDEDKKAVLLPRYYLTTQLI